MAAPIRVLLVDDHTLFRSGIKALLLREPGFEVVGEAGDGLEGVKRAIEQLRAELPPGTDLDIVVDSSTYTAKSFNTVRRALMEAVVATGLILLLCGVYGNVVRFLFPLTIEDEIFEEALQKLVAAIKA